MKKILICYLITFLSLIASSCGNKQSGPQEIKLTRDNVLDYFKIEVSYNSEINKLEIMARAASSSYSFSRYTGFEVMFLADSIRDFEESFLTFDVYFDVEIDGRVEIDCDRYFKEQAIVFTSIYVTSGVDGYVTINGNQGAVDSGCTFLSNDEQREIYQTYVNQIPQPGDETYGSSSCLYRYNDYSNQTGLALYSASGGDIICASRSYKHNNEKVTEIGDGGPLIDGYIGGIYGIQNDTITSIVLSKYTEKINDSAFTLAKNLRTIELPSTLKYIGREAFFNASLVNGIELPDGLEFIGSFAFASTKLKVIYIPASVKTIEEYAFKYCHDLVIYCEATSKPDGWSYFWDNVSDKDNLTVYWGATRSQAK